MRFMCVMLSVCALLLDVLQGAERFFFLLFFSTGQRLLHDLNGTLKIICHIKVTCERVVLAKKSYTSQCT